MSWLKSVATYKYAYKTQTLCYDFLADVIIFIIMDTEIRYTYKKEGLEEHGTETLSKSIYREYTSELKLENRLTLKNANFIAHKWSCKPFLKEIKDSLTFEHEDFDKMYAKLMKLELVTLELDMY